MIEISITAGLFYSENDEECFFKWLDSMRFFSDRSYCGDQIILKCDNTLSKDELWDLLAFFYRYKQDLKILRVFENDDNVSWLKNKKMFWHRRMYGNQKI